jgi:hypothetical protein
MELLSSCDWILHATRMTLTTRDDAGMADTQSAIEVVIFTDENGNSYAFTREQLAEARVSSGTPSDVSVTSELIMVNAGLNKKPDGRW